jgi:hypothetical protein
LDVIQGSNFSAIDDLQISAVEQFRSIASKASDSVSTCIGRILVTTWTGCTTPQPKSIIDLGMWQKFGPYQLESVVEMGKLDVQLTVEC